MAEINRSLSRYWVFSERKIVGLIVKEQESIFLICKFISNDFRDSFYALLSFVETEEVSDCDCFGLIKLVVFIVMYSVFNNDERYEISAMLMPGSSFGCITQQLHCCLVIFNLLAF